MRLVRIAIRAFQCIEQAEVDFGPGLNVLYGPNDLGKSSLAAAIRNVLLLPHGSTAHEQLVSWHGGEPPRVALTFSTEAQRFWRVTKTFGSGSAGSSTLEFSRDGSSFAVEATGREVDAKVRELLSWGLGMPGGRSAARGLPDSFLTNVLLAEQADVPRILARGLTGDPDESGRDRLNVALQALAQDPLFKRILDETQAHVDRAFTSTGQRSRRQGSPFKDAADEINELERQQRELQGKLNETLAAEATLRGLHAELDERTAALADAVEEERRVSAARAQTEARAAVDAELEVARAALDAVVAELAQVDEAGRTVESLRQQVDTAETSLAQRAKAVEDATRVRDQARRRVEEAIGETGAQARELAAQQLENERLTKTARRAELRTAVQEAEEAARRRDEADRSRAELEELGARLADGERAVAAATEAENAARGRVEGQRLLEGGARLREARRKVRLAEEAAAAAVADRDAAGRKRAEAERLEQELVELRLPDAGVVATLRALAQELEVAEARLGGGLSVTLEPLRDVAVEVAVDGAAPEERRGRDPVGVEARRSVELRVGDLLRVRIAAGEAAARAAVERLRARWSAEGAPVLERAGAATPAALEEAHRRAEEMRRRIAALGAEEAALGESARQQERRAEDLDASRRLAAERERALAGRDSPELAAELEELGDAWETELERRRAAAEAEARAAAGELEEARARVAAAKAQHAERHDACRKLAEAAERALAPFADGVERVLEAGRAELEEIERALADVGRKIEELTGRAEREAGEAQADLDAATRRLAEATEGLERARRERDEKRDVFARAGGDFDARRRQAERLDRAAAEERVAAIAARLAEMPVPESPAGAEDMRAAADAVAAARRAVAEKQGEIHKAQGGLEQVGGAVVREQKEEVDRALAIALEKQRRVEVEYEAWRLLAATLREVENSDGAHLGKALAGPVGERLRALTGDRYARLALGQQLETEGIEAAGHLRPFEALSVGTQDQLATLFRLCIAEHLGTAVVLDDHLSQSDAGKIGAFRELLRRTGESIQVVLITCRPEDYLLAGELPEGEDVSRDRAAGSLRAIDLARAIRRYALGVAPPERGRGEPP